MSKSIVVAGDSTRWVHLMGDGKPAIHTLGGLEILRHLISLWCDGSTVSGLTKSSPLPAEYIEWKKVPLKLRDEKVGKTDVWRASARLGSDDEPEIPEIEYEASAVNPDILVLLETDRGFAGKNLLPSDVKAGWKGQLIVQVQALPDPATAQASPFWKLLTSMNKQLTMVMDAEALRMRGAVLSRGLSWDRTIEEIATEMTEGLSANDLGGNRRTVITFGLSGAAVFHGRNLERFLYEPGHAEGLWEKVRPGLPLMTCLAATAAVARHEANPRDNPLFVALHDALNFASNSFENGEDLRKGVYEDNLVHKAKHALKSTHYPDKGEKNPPRAYYCAYPHGILSHSELRSQKQTTSNLLQDVTGVGFEYVAARAAQVVIAGTDAALSGVPSARFGKFFTVDRDEIERLQTIRRQVESYRENREIERPLSLAVFGQPGSGKSFAIKQLAEALFGKEAQVFEFNLTQFQQWEDLVLAFHQIRDAAAKGRMPFVFWDEFDTGDFKWLQHFLAPMQDSEFHSAGHAFPFGRGIFVFAGGVAYTMDAFKAKVGKETTKKGPDFISRLHGYLDVKGPNPVQMTGKSSEVTPQKDPAHLIRRAIIMRIAIERFQPQILDDTRTANISTAVVRAFLRAKEFQHGARSIEALISQSRVSPSFQPADLPPKLVVDLHVDDSFETQLKAGQIQMPVQEALAKACHDAWWAKKDEKFPDKTSADAIKHAAFKDYATAGKKHQDSSRQSARATEAKLAELELRIGRKGTGKAAHLDKTQISRLEDIEHDLWLRDYLIRGYEPAAETRDSLRQHKCVCSFSELTEEDKSLDNAIARSIESTLELFGYQLMKT